MSELTVSVVSVALANNLWVVADPSNGQYSYTVDINGSVKTIQCSLVRRDQRIFALSYRWNCGRCRLSGKDVPYTFIDYINKIHPEKQVWVDFLNHLGNRECTAVVVDRMAEVYEKNQVLAMYLDPNVMMSADDRFLQAMRGWMWQELSVNQGIETCVTTLGKMIRNVFKWNTVHDGIGIPPSIWQNSPFRVWCEIVMIYKCTAPHNVRPCMYQAWFGYASDVLKLRGAALLADIGHSDEYNEWLDDFDQRNDPKRLIFGAISNLKSVHFTNVEDCVVASLSALSSRWGINLTQADNLLAVWEQICIAMGGDIQLDLASGAQILTESFGKLMGTLKCELTYWKTGRAPRDVLAFLQSEAGKDTSSAKAVFRLTCGDGVVQYGVGQIEKLHDDTPYCEITAQQPDTRSTSDVSYCVRILRSGSDSPSGSWEGQLLYVVYPNAHGGLRWMNDTAIVLRREGGRFFRSERDPHFAGSDSSPLIELGQ